jgi:hypothetical protein
MIVFIKAEGAAHGFYSNISVLRLSRKLPSSFLQINLSWFHATSGDRRQLFCCRAAFAENLPTAAAEECLTPAFQPRSTPLRCAIAHDPCPLADCFRRRSVPRN